MVDYVGSNAKMNEFQAAMGLCNLKHVDEEITKSKKAYECYMEQLNGVEGLQLMQVQEDVKPNYAYFPVIIDENEYGATRNQVFDALAQNNIYSRKYFYPLTNTYDCFHGKFDINATPIALHISKRVLTLPMFADLDQKKIEQICYIIKQIGANNG